VPAPPSPPTLGSFNPNVSGFLFDGKRISVFPIASPATPTPYRQNPASPSLPPGRRGASAADFLIVGGFYSEVALQREGHPPNAQQVEHRMEREERKQGDGTHAPETDRYFVILLF
jgi:hypothetical protein